MALSLKGRNVLGLNGLGRIGKLSLWYHLHRRHFDGIVINTGREVGESLEHICDVIATDSTYGPLSRFLQGVGGQRDLQVVDEAEGLLAIHGLPVKILRRARNPKDIGWRAEGVRLVVDTTGVFGDPTVPADDPKGSLRGHLEAGARKVLNSAPFKIKDKAKKTPDDAAMLIFGINHTRFDPGRHHVLSAASCTTTGLAHMMKPLLEAEETSRILTASMSTIHAATNTQSVLDSVPKAGATDRRKTRAALGNIILSTTGAAKALEQVLPEIQQVGFMADSVRIPTQTVSLINLNVTFHSWLDEKGDPAVSRAFINDLYRKASEGSQKDLLVFTERQNVSADMLGLPAAVVIEGHDNHTRTGFVELPADLLRLQGIECDKPVRMPVTHAKLFGWYDNEYGSYTHCLGELTVYVDKSLG
ncbi:MAG: glyceraldehyde-3-phosphate dehydrogenase [Deltaproteobacteria bacterium]|nr:glyceraldehyde-3-phosphate dehydrogenase [Deltaproteobacteria bacterium]